MPETSTERRFRCLHALQSTTCGGCSGPKPSRKSVCGKCYSKLPKNLQSRLYRKIGDGYEEAFDNALTYLTLGNDNG